MLHRFLSTHREVIIAHARSSIGRTVDPCPSDADVESGIALVLDQLIDTLVHSRSAAGLIAASATQRGGEFSRRGFTVAQVIDDYGSLRGAITDLAAEANALIPSGEARALHECLDTAISGAVAGFVREREQAILRDETERRGELAHELRNALSSARISFDMISAGSVGVGGSTSALLGRSLTRLSTLVDRSVAHVRLDSGLNAPERVSVRAFVEEVEVGAALEAMAQGMTLAVAPVDAGIDVEIDRPLLAAALSNLLQNAFKFSRPHGHVSLHTFSTPQRVLIDVEDECGGLPPGAAEELFLPFVQRGRSRVGMGLGLSFSRKSVHASGGELRVKDLPGRGCVFTIDLPRLTS